MCGLAGHVAAPGAVADAAAVERMVAALRHRGPDGEGVEVAGQVALGHTRLAIVDPTPAGRQPMASGDGRLLLTYNGEVFNHLELRAELGGPWRSGCDTETLVRAWSAWGPEAVSRFNGLYAFAVLDRERRRLWLVRDRFGVKPLYWARHDGGILFASEQRALLEAGVARAVRTDVLAHALARAWANGPLTPIEGIRRVLPGSLVEIDLDTLSARELEWYDPLAAVDAERMRALAEWDRERALAEVERELRASVERRLMADVPVGVMCSGGIDSTLTTAYANDAQPGILAFNASIADQPEHDEHAFATRAAELIGCGLHTVRMTGADWRRDFVGVVTHIEYPLTHPSSVPMAQIAGLARDSGVKVLLSGEGADELLAGYPWLNLHEHGDFLGRDRPHERLLRPVVRWWQRRGGDWPGRYPVPGPGEAVNGYEREQVERADRAYSHESGPRRRLDTAIGALPRLYLPHLLNRQDKATMRHSIETRTPFLDPALAELALNLPLELKVEPERKWLLRELVRRRFGQELGDRAKVGFGMDGEAMIVPHARPEFLRAGRLRELLGVSREEWIARVERTHGYPALQLWSGEVWARTVLGGEPADDVSEALWA